MKSVFLGLALLGAVCACAPGDSRQTGNEAAAPTPAPMAFSERPSTPAEALFVEKCAMCHRENGMGTNMLARRMPKDVSMLETRKDLTADYIRAAVRGGIGNMPRLSRGEVSDEQLTTIIGHLVKEGGDATGAQPNEAAASPAATGNSQ